LKTKYSNVFINPTESEVDDFRNIIAFDLDSVMNFGCSNAIRKIFCKTFDITEAEIVDTDPVHLVAEAVIDESPSFLTTPFMPEVMEYVYKVTGKPITVITARRPECLDVTYRWLREHLGATPFVCYIMHGKEKGPVVDMLNVSIFIDDRFKTIKNMLSWCEYPVLYKQEWNQNRPVRLPVLEIRDLRDIIPLLNIKLGRVPMAWPEGLPYPKPEGERITKKYATVIF
jgi:hypothetical protein